ncbi:MAG: fructose-1,6-bisphosphatase/inositol monophosphatase family enzyme, partial [Lentimonas sp.]
AVFQTNNCSSLELAHLACGKIDLCVFKKEDRELLDSILIIAEEAGAKIEEKEGLIFVKNEKLKI